MIPRPESSLYVNMQVGRKILVAKIEIVNCLLVFCNRKSRFKLFSESSCSTATEPALVRVKNGSTSDQLTDTGKHDHITPESSWLADYRGATLVAGRDNDAKMC